MIAPFAPAQPASPEESVAAKPTLLPWAIRVSLILTVIGFGTSFYLSRTLSGSQVASVSRDARMAGTAGEPETTGSIGEGRGPARDVRLDPCNASADLRLR